MPGLRARSRASARAIIGSSIALLFAAAAPAAGAEPLRLTLADAVERARTASPRIEQLSALERAQSAAQAGARSQRGPQLDVTAGYTRYSSVPELLLAIPGQEPKALFPDIPDSFRSRVKIAVPLYTGGRNPALISAAESESAAARGDLAAGTRDAVLETTTAYWSLVVARESERVLAEALESYASHLRDAENRQRFGLAAANEVLAVKVERDQADLARIRAANAATVAEANLARLIGLPPVAAIDPSDPLVAAAPGLLPQAELLALALERRPELRALAERARAAEARVTAQQAGRRPQVFASAGYDYANPNRLIVPAADSWRGTWDVGVTASWTALDHGRTSAAVAEARARAEAVRAARTDAERRIALEVTRARLDVVAADESVRVAEETVVAARENRRVSEERYRAGVSLSSELLDAETGLLRAGLDRIGALAELRIAAAALDRAVGN